MKRTIITSLLLGSTLLAGCTAEGTEVKEKEKEVTVGVDGNEAEKDQTGEQETESAQMNVEPIGVEHTDIDLYDAFGGVLSLWGHTVSEEGNPILVLRLDGELTYVDGEDFQFRLVYENGDSLMVQPQDRTHIVEEDGAEYHVYRAKGQASGNLIRVDFAVDEGIHDAFNEDDFETFQIEPTDKRIDVPGIEGHPSVNFNILRENDEMRVAIASLESGVEETNYFRVKGFIEYNRDMKEPTSFRYAGTAFHNRGAFDIGEETGETANFAGTMIDLDRWMDFPYPMGKGTGEKLVFSIGHELFHVDATKGEELDTVPLTRFAGDYEPVPIDGYMDSKAHVVYDAVKVDGFSEPLQGDAYHAVWYPIGGYDTFEFQIGAHKNASFYDGDYDVRVYGDDYGKQEGEEPTGTVLWEGKVDRKTPLKEVSVDVKGNETVTLHIDTNIPTGDEALGKEMFPVILANVKAMR